MINYKIINTTSLLLGLLVGGLLGYFVFDYFPARTANKDSKAIVMMKNSEMNMHSNPYDMGAITSESQFLKEMKLHHEAAVTMAIQVLKVKNIHGEVKNLANAIISAQTSEIKMMSTWITDWKY